MTDRMSNRTVPGLARLLFSGLVLLAPPAAAHGRTNPGAGPFDPGTTPARFAPDRVVDLEHVAIRVRPDLVEQRLEGRIELRGTLLDPSAAELVLHGVRLEIAKAQVDGQVAHVRTSGEQVKVALRPGRKRGDRIELALTWRSNDPRAGVYFMGPPARSARERSLTKGDASPPKRGLPERRPRLQAWTQGEMHEHRHWLPIWDYPNDRFTSEWHVEAPPGFTVIANGRFLGTKNGKQAGWKVWSFAQEQDHVSYLLSFVVGRYEKVSDVFEGKPVEYYTYPGTADEAMASFGKTPEVMKLFSDLIGVRYPYAKYAQTVVQEFTFGGMENISATTQTDRTLHPARLQPAKSSESLVAHELAHQWWGDLLTCRDWSHIWLNEGFATYFAALWFEHSAGQDEFDLYRRDRARSYFTEANRYQRPIVTRHYKRAVAMFDRHTYPKGGWVLHMLRRELGDDAFWAAMREYAKANAYGLVDTADFSAAVREATGRNMDAFFQQWVYSAGHPRVRSTWSYDARAKQVEIRIEQLQERVLSVPLDLEIYVGSKPIARRVRLRDRELAVVLPAEQRPRFVLVDAGRHLLAEIEAEQDVAANVAQLRGAGRAIDRMVAADQLGRTRLELELATSALSRALAQDSFHGVAEASAKALGAIGTAPAYRALRQSASATDPRVRKAVLEALGTARTSQRDTNLEPVVERLKSDPNDEVRAAAAKALGELGHERAARHLRRALRRRSHHNVVEEEAARALGKAGRPRDHRVLLKLLEPHRPTYVRMAAVDGLVAMDGRSGVLTDDARRDSIASITAMLGDRNPRIRRKSVDSLSNLAARQTLPRLRQLATRDANAKVRTAAEDAIERLSAPADPPGRTREE